MSPERPRGLSSLLSSSLAGPNSTGQGRPSSEIGSEDPARRDPHQTRIIDVPLGAVIPNPKQPRRRFRKEAIDSLADSISKHGLLQPIVVRPSGKEFELIAGERRWRAAKAAGLQTIRAICKTVNDAETLTLSIVENLQRENLDPIEEAAGYKALKEELGLTHEQIGNFVGKDRTTISNSLRLLELPASIQAALVSGSLSQGHARVLLAVSDQDLRAALAKRAADRGMSVRELERIVYKDAEATSFREGGKADKPAHIKDLEQQISEKLGMRAQIKEGKRGGKLVVRFKTNAEFMRILDLLDIEGSQV